MLKLNAKELRTTKAEEVQKKDLRRNPIFIICDNILDTYNVGSIFRLADAVAAEKVFLCGNTETPPNTRIKKASINTTEWVSWNYVENAEDVIANLREQFSAGIQIVAIEQDQNSLPFNTFNYQLPLALVIGNETTGIGREVLDACDAIVELPMFGVNKSLNVMVSLGIVLYQVVAIATKNT